jgi:L-iditol 2-dehydrogenase
MKALVNFSAEPRSVELRDLPVPATRPDQVLLQVKAVGVCGSDLHQWLGNQSWKVNYPVTLGHEFCGVISEVGADVTQFKPGDRVVSETHAVVDESSPYWRTGQYHIDPARLGFGYGVNGAMAEFVAVPERCLHRLPENLPFEKAALVEPCCVAYNAVCCHGAVRPGESVAVIGPGPIGLLCAQMAKISGANPLFLIGTPADEARLKQGLAVGVDKTFDGSEDPLSAILGAGDGYGCDIAIDAAGVSATLDLAIRLVRPGGRIVKVGWGPQPYGMSLDPLVQKAITLHGSFSHNWPIWERVIHMLATGQIDLTHILSLTAPLDEWESAFNAMHRGSAVKAVLIP